MKRIEEGGYRSGISGAFRKNHESSVKTAPGFLQLVIFTILLGGFVGWVLYGNLVVYLLMAFIPVYLFLRLRKQI